MSIFCCCCSTPLQVQPRSGMEAIPAGTTLKQWGMEVSAYVLQLHMLGVSWGGFYGFSGPDVTELQFTLWAADNKASTLNLRCLLFIQVEMSSRLMTVQIRREILAESFYKFENLLLCIISLFCYWGIYIVLQLLQLVIHGPAASALSRKSFGRYNLCPALVYWVGICIFIVSSGMHHAHLSLGSAAVDPHWSIW